MKTEWLLAAACAAFPAVPSALAQEAQLYCAGNDALVRFNDAPLPAGDNSRWATVAPAPANRCRLANGSEVVMRARQTQGTPWGMGGGNREAVFSLWADRKKIVSREEFWPHVMRADHDYTTNHALYSPGAIHVCRYAKGQLDLRQTENVICEKRRVDLAKLPTDPLEPKDDADLGKITFTSTYNAAFCESFIARKGTKSEISEHGNTFRLGRILGGDELAIGKPGQALPFAYGQATTLYERRVVSIRVAQFDMLNIGEVQTVVEFAGQHSMFNGNFFMVRDGVADEADLRKLVDLSKNATQQADEMEASAYGGWRMLRSREGDNTEHDVIRIADMTFVLARPSFEQDGPDAVLYRMTDGYRAFTPVCTFQSVWPNL